MNLANTLWTVSLDGQEILLVLYEDGPSDDPYTYRFQYKDENIIEAGGFADDIRQCKISPDGIITGASRMDVVQTGYVTVSWHLDPTGILQEIPQDVYDFTNGNWMELNGDPASAYRHEKRGNLRRSAPESKISKDFRGRRPGAHRNRKRTAGLAAPGQFQCLGITKRCE